MESKCWLWPDHAIGKRESRELREEHNAVVNAHAELLTAASIVLSQFIEANPKFLIPAMDSLATAIFKAEGA